MRIFYAVNFDNNVKTALSTNLMAVKKHTLKGNFTSPENFHVTLLFVGECDNNRVAALKQIADNAAARINTSHISAVISGLSSFTRVGEELLWVGIETEPKGILHQMSAILFEEAKKSGIKLQGDNKKFIPHITLARKVEFWRMSGKDIGKINFDPIHCQINSITLMESVQETVPSQDIRDRRMKLVYKPLHEAIIYSP